MAPSCFNGRLCTAELRRARPVHRTGSDLLFNDEGCQVHEGDARELALNPNVSSSIAQLLDGTGRYFCRRFVGAPATCFDRSAAREGPGSPVHYRNSQLFSVSPDMLPTDHGRPRAKWISSNSLDTSSPVPDRPIGHTAQAKMSCRRAQTGSADLGRAISAPAVGGCSCLSWTVALVACKSVLFIFAFSS
jgi:hypothetical protein